MNQNIIEAYELRLLDTWEDVYKKGQLTLWILLALKARPMHMVDIKQFIKERTNDTLTADDKSMYRALRRFYQIELVSYHDSPSDRGGPDRKVYSLTDSGYRVLEAFIQRNVLSVYFKKENQQLFKGK